MQTAALGDGNVAVISAGWQEAEGDIDELRKLIPNPLFDLNLYHRADEIFHADEALYGAYRRRQDQLIEQQQMYKLRLRHLTVAARDVLRADGSGAAIAEERRHAISQLRALDRHHLRQVGKINAHFAEEFGPKHTSALIDHNAAIREELARCETVLITGGNVVVLSNRLRLLGVESLLQDKNIVAWSAGAMALCDRSILFHDRLPQGRQDSEILAEGAGIVRDAVLLPNAHGRLRMNEPIRIGLFSRRFSPACSLTLDNGAYLLFAGDTLRDCGAVRQLSHDGKSAKLRAA